MARKDLEERKAYAKTYHQRPEVKARISAWQKEYYKRPEIRKRTIARVAAYQEKRYREQRAVIVDALGGNCQDCQTTEGLEFHHVNGDGHKKKETTPTLYKKYMDNPDEFKSSFNLLCRKCHMKRHRMEKYVAEKKVLQEIILKQTILIACLCNKLTQENIQWL